MLETAFLLHPQNPSPYLRELVEKVYAVSLSGETLRPLLAVYRKEQKALDALTTQSSCYAAEESTGGAEPDDILQELVIERVENNDLQKDTLPTPSADRKRSACFPTAPRYLPHAGLLLFLPMLNALAKV